MLIGDPLLRCCVFYQKIAATEAILANFQKYFFCEDKASKGKKNDILEN